MITLDIAIQLAFLRTGESETPLPTDVPPTALLDLGTGSAHVESGAAELVRTARRRVAAVAVLPINPEHDALVDQLVEARVTGTARKRPLGRSVDDPPPQRRD
jgi:hypothetical protein